MSLDFYLEEEPVCQHCGRYCADVIHCQNITHNLAAMAREAEIYAILWKPEENGITQAKQIVGPLTKAIAEMKANPPRLEKHDSPNGWGLYVNFVPWLERLLAKCLEYPEAYVRASR